MLSWSGNILPGIIAGGYFILIINKYWSKERYLFDFRKEELVISQHQEIIGTYAYGKYCYETIINEKNRDIMEK
ncbi:MAG: hypothetical protein GX786_10655 [Clostridiales bacterium]|nr:hypothetical protein [Clostridiales bacterium]